MRAKYIPYFPSLPPRSSPLGLPHLTLAPGSTGVQYCTSQPALLRLPAHFRRIARIFRPADVMHSAPHLQVLAVRCALLFPVRPHGPSVYFLSFSTLCPPKLWRWICAPSPAVSVASGTLDKGGPCHFNRITSYRLSIVRHQHSVASRSNMRRNGFGENNHCEPKAIGHWVPI